MSEGRSFRASLFAGAVIALATLASGLALRTGPLGGPADVLVWAIAALASQLLVVPTPTGRSEVTLSTCVHLCMALLLPPGVFLPALWVSRAAALGFQQKPWLRSLFNAAQVTAAVLAAWWTMKVLGATTPSETSMAAVLERGPAFLAGALAYYVVNMAAVAIVVGLSSGRSAWRTWREGYGYAAEILGTVALVLLAPVCALTYRSFGPPGLAVFFLPLVFLRDSSLRYVTLRRAQEDLLAAECLAARGSLAVEVGHEINDSLAGAQGQLQLLLRAGGSLTPAQLEERVRKVSEPLARIDVLSKGLMDFTRRDTKVEPVELSELVQRTVSFLRYQKRFSKVRFELELDREISSVWLDPTQIQQALMSLLLNGADAMNAAESPRRRLTIRTCRGFEGRIEIHVSDTGPGIPAELRTRIFEPGFTTRPMGRGFGLTTVHAIARSHRGDVEVADAPEGGATFVLSLRSQRPPGSIAPERLSVRADSLPERELRLAPRPRAA